MSPPAEVRLWGRRIGAVVLGDGEPNAAFQFAPEFVRSGIEVSPLVMPLRAAPYVFPSLAPVSFHGLPGLLADSLPDRYGNALIDAWLARQGREPDSFDSVERLCYVGKRGMGGLEFEPVLGPRSTESERIDVSALAELAAEVLAKRIDLSESLAADKERALKELLRVGTSAGGARAKALIALHPGTNEVRSGQGQVDPGFQHWILKFDGVDDDSRDLGLAHGYGVIEFAYSQMARSAGIEMTETRLLDEGGRRHFMTRRFDRRSDGEKIHMQSLAALWHLDFNQPGGNSYEQAFGVIRRLNLGRAAIEQMFRRMVFNVVARNHDDHVKNIAFLMDQAGNWSLTPAFDLVYAYNPSGRWTAQHQMSVNGMREGITMGDFNAVGELAAMKRGRVEQLVEEVIEAVRTWPELAATEGIEPARIERIVQTHRLDIASA